MYDLILVESLVFPTHVGMNREKGRIENLARGVPHACGDEPNINLTYNGITQVFPTHVGMNRHTEIDSR